MRPIEFAFESVYYDKAAMGWISWFESMNRMDFPNIVEYNENMRSASGMPLYGLCIIHTEIVWLTNWCFV